MLAATHGSAAKRVGLHDRSPDDPEGIMPTRLYERDASSSNVRVVASNARGTVPATMQRELVRKMLSEGPRHLPQSAPRRLTKTYLPANVFLTPAAASDPPPPWARVLGQRVGAVSRPSRRRQSSLLPLVTIAMAAAICVGLARDANARKEFIGNLTHVSARVSAIFANLAPR